MKNLERRALVKSLEEGASISDIVEQLKQEIRKDPYLESAHRLLGDLYLTRLNHGSYAVSEYRKLQKIQEQPRATDQLRLAWSYLQRDFEEKSYRVLQGIEREQLPEEFEILDETVETDQLIGKLEEQLGEMDPERSRQWFEKHRDEGLDYLDTGNPFQAQRSFEKALDYRDDPDLRCELARCLLSRRQYPRAVENLKQVLTAHPEHDQASELLEQAYDRLGIDPDKTGEREPTSRSRRRAG